jgi:transcriptional regulator with XRE-family HTH domain
MPRGHVLPHGSKIARLRGEAGLTQSDLAELAGFGLRTIGKIEGGQRPVATTLSAVATVLGRKLQRRVTLGDLLLPADGVPEGTVLAADPPGLVVAEIVKVLDLRLWQCGTGGEGPGCRSRASFSSTGCGFAGFRRTCPR